MCVCVCACVCVCVCVAVLSTGGPTDRYDSVQGYIRVGDEFVVYQNARAFPMFAVYYTTKTERKALVSIMRKPTVGYAPLRHL